MVDQVSNSESERTMEALCGLIGLWQLVRGRSDMPPSLRADFEASHRWRTALAVSAGDEMDEDYDCPIHGLQEGPDCPRC